eukprot:gene17864-biopygen12918
METEYSPRYPTKSSSGANVIPAQRQRGHHCRRPLAHGARAAAPRAAAVARAAGRRNGT